jgi:hypothetical protein
MTAVHPTAFKQQVAKKKKKKKKKKFAKQKSTRLRYASGRTNYQYWEWLEHTVGLIHRIPVIK